MTSSAEMQFRLQSGLAMHQQGRLGEAEKIYQEILLLDRKNFDALHLLGVVSYQVGRYQEAVDFIWKAITINPNIPIAYSNLGNALKVMKRFDDALISYSKAITLSPDDADAHGTLGGLLQELGRFDEALASYSQAVTLRPDFAEAHFNHGNSLRALKRLDEALASYNKAVEADPKHAEAWSNRGNTLRDLRRLEEAAASYNSAIACRPGFAEAYNNLGTALHDLRRFNEAVAGFDRAIQLRPGYAEAFYNRGLSLKALKRFDEAIASFNRATEIRPDYAAAFLDKSYVELLTGDFVAGWKDYEWRSKGEIPRGSPLTSLDEAVGKTVLVHWEQGLGDTLQFCRYAGLLKEHGVKVLLAPQPGLNSLLKPLDKEVALVDAGNPTLVCDFHIPLMSLPRLFGTTLKTIPSQTPYLFADPAGIKKWKTKIGNRGFKIGICWQGNSSHKDDAFRSFSINLFQPLAAVPKVRLISLLKGDGEEQLRALPDGMAVEVPGEGYAAGSDIFVDTAAVMMSLDLVITADTSIAHLAGALGVPVWVAVKYVAEWRWMDARSDSPWYPSMRLFRQKSDGDWKGVFEDMKTALSELTGNRPV